MKIVVLDGHTLNPGDLSWQPLEALGELTVYDRTPSAQIVERSQGAKVILVNKTPMRAEHLKALPDLEYVGVLATGYNTVDVDAAKALGIVVTNIPSYGTQAVAQFVFAHLLNICHHVASHGDSVRQGKWQRNVDFCYWDKPLIELAGKTMGIVGAGRIGIATANIAQSFGMNVIVYNPRPKDLPSDTMKNVTFDALLEQSDVISLHCPLTDDTRGLINADALSKMKEGVILINTSRGPLIDERALAIALKSGKVYAAGLDVLSKEPPEMDNPLIAIEACTITPHIAWAPIEARSRLLAVAISNVKHFIDGSIENQVNA